MAEEKKFGAEEFVAVYKSLAQDPKKVTELPFLDEQRKDEYLAAIQRAEKEKDPAKKYENFARLFSSIKQSGAYHIGLPKANEMGAEPGEDRMSMAIQFGLRTLEDLLE